MEWSVRKDIEVLIFPMMLLLKCEIPFKKPNSYFWHPLSMCLVCLLGNPALEVGLPLMASCLLSAPSKTATTTLQLACLLLLFAGCLLRRGGDVPCTAMPVMHVLFHRTITREMGKSSWGATSQSAAFYQIPEQPAGLTFCPLFPLEKGLHHVPWYHHHHHF